MAVQGSIDTKICGDEKIKCFVDAAQHFSEVDLPKDSAEYVAETFREKCNCLPACVSIEYASNIEYIQYDVEILKRSFKNVSFL